MRGIIIIIEFGKYFSSGFLRGGSETRLRKDYGEEK
jgi:hypothetical protein